MQQIDYRQNYIPTNQQNFDNPRILAPTNMNDFTVYATSPNQVGIQDCSWHLFFIIHGLNLGLMINQDITVCNLIREWLVIKHCWEITKYLDGRKFPTSRSGSKLSLRLAPIFVLLVSVFKRNDIRIHSDPYFKFKLVESIGWRGNLTIS